MATPAFLPPLQHRSLPSSRPDSRISSAKACNDEEKQPLTDRTDIAADIESDVLDLDATLEASLSSTIALTPTLDSLIDNANDDTAILSLDDICAAMPERLSLSYEHTAQRLETIGHLWRLFDSDVARAVALFGNVDHVSALTAWLDTALSQANGLKAKYQRNHLVATFGLLASYDTTRTAIALSGALELLVSHASHGLTVSNDRRYRFTHTNDAADIELRQLLWGLVAQCSEDWLSLSVIAQSSIVSTLLAIVDAAAQCNDTAMIDSQQAALVQCFPFSVLLDLQHTVLLTLTSLASTLPIKFAQERAVERLCVFIEQIDANPLNRSDKALAAHQCRQLKALAIKCCAHSHTSQYGQRPHPSIEAMIDTASAPPSTPARLARTNIIRTLTAIIADPSASSESRCDAVHCVSLLCQDSDEQRRLARKQKTVHTIAQLLQDTPFLASELAKFSGFVFALCDFLVRVVSDDSRSTEVLMAFDGVDAVLDLCCVAQHSPMVTCHALRALGGIALQPNVAAVQRVREWRRPAAVLRSNSASIRSVADSGKDFIGVVDLTLALWHRHSNTSAGSDVDSDEAVLRTVHAFLAAVGFDSFPDASPDQCAQLVHIRAWPAQRSLRQWQQLYEQVKAQPDAEYLCAEDEARIQSRIASLAEQVAMDQQCASSLAAESQALSEVQFRAYLSAVNERRMEEQTNVIERMSYGVKSKRSNQRAVTQLRPSSAVLVAKKGNSSLYGKFRAVPTFQPRRVLDEESKTQLLEHEQ